MTKPFSFALNLLLVCLVSSLATLTPLRAHEVQPTIMDVTLSEDRIEIVADWMIEAAVSGLDLTALTNTTDAENDDEYDRLRALPPEELAAATEAAWPDIAERFALTSGETALVPELVDVRVPEVGNLEVARISRLTLSAALPAGGDPVVLGLSSDLGPIVVRQRGVENGYAAFLTPGSLSDPIPRSGGSTQTAGEAFVDYIAVGFDHIVPQGLDHILFVLGLFFLSLRLGPLLWQVTAFTLAHTVTLALGALDIIRLPAEIVEPIIAASIVYVGIENVLMRKMAPWRPIVVFCFGLLHGLGFAAVLQDFGLGADHFVPKLIGFNIGVEVGQLAVIAAAWLALAAFFGRYGWYHRRIGAPVSIAIALIAAFWVLERTGTISVDGPWSLFSALTEGGFAPLMTVLVVSGIATLLTAIEMFAIEQDWFRDFAGMATSFALFLGVVATFTSGGYVLTAVLTVVWVICLKLQSLGGPYEPAENVEMA